MSGASGINASGQVVGMSTTSGDTELRAFMYSAGTMTDLGSLGGRMSGALGINASGQIVGFSLTSGDTEMHAFLYSGGTMTDLNDLIDPAQSGYKVLHGMEGIFINDAGQIATTGCNSAGRNCHAYS